METNKQFKERISFNHQFIDYLMSRFDLSYEEALFRSFNIYVAEEEKEYFEEVK